MSDTTNDQGLTESRHEISAFYAGGPGDQYYQPVLECSCGFSTGRQIDWEEAGIEMDGHLMQVQR